jgi:hypothetical protein
VLTPEMVADITARVVELARADGERVGMRHPVE